MGGTGRVVWAHDHVFVRTPSGELFSEGKLPAAVWDRYLDAFAEVVVCARVRAPRPGESLARLSPTERPGVTFRELPNLVSRSHFRAARAEGRRVLQAAIGGADAVIARLPSEAGLLALRVARALGRPAAVEVVGCAWDAYWNHGALLARAYAPIAYLRMRRAVARADAALYVTEAFLQHRYPSTAPQVACSNVELTAPPREVLTSRLARTGPVLRLGCIGSPAAHYKGIDLAIDALARLGPGAIQLSVVGGGDASPLRQRAARLGLEARVHFEGALPAGTGIAAWLDTVDVYIQPSRQEGVPRALIEAMARGCPAIGSTAGGIPELLGPEALHPVGDVGALARQLGRALADAGWRAVAAERNFDAARRFDRSVLGPRRAEFWRRFSERAVSASMR